MIAPKYRFIKFIVAVIAMLLAACSEPRGEGAINNYHARLQNVLEGLISKPETINPVAFDPALQLPRSVVIDKPNDQASSINLLDFLGLHGCRLQQVVADANSSLGKLAPASRQLISALDFIEFTPECIEQMLAEEKPELAEQLSQARAQKVSQVDWLFAKAVLGGDEYKQFWKRPSQLGDYPSGTSQEPVRAIEALAGLQDVWRTGPYSQGRDSLETHLFHLSTGDGGALILAHQTLLNGINRLNALLEQALGADRLCSASPGYDAKILQNVVQKFFISDVQVWAAELNRRTFTLEDAIQDLELALEPLVSQEYSAWKQNRSRLFIQTKEAIKQHVQKLKVFLEPETLEAWCAAR